MANDSGQGTGLEYDYEDFVSVLMANYNNSRYLNEAIESVLNQHTDKWEIVFVDDASTDDSIELIRELAKNEDRIRIFENDENKGCGFTKRRCVQEARGRYFLFLDPDDKLHPETLSTLLEIARDNTDIAVCYGQHVLCDSGMKELEISNVTKAVPAGWSILNLRGAGPSHPALCRISLYRKTPGINPELKRAVDRDLYLKMEEQGKLHFHKRPLYYYRRHEKGIATGKINELKARYWAIRVDENAIERRKSKGLNLPVDRSFMNYRWERYYLQKADLAVEQRKWSSLYYHICQAFRRRPFSSHFLLKLKYLFAPLKN